MNRNEIPKGFQDGLITTRIKGTLTLQVSEEEKK